MLLLLCFLPAGNKNRAADPGLGSGWRPLNTSKACLLGREVFRFPAGICFFSAGNQGLGVAGEGKAPRLPGSGKRAYVPLGVGYLGKYKQVAMPHFSACASQCRQRGHPRFPLGAANLLGCLSKPGFCCMSRSYSRSLPSVKCNGSPPFPHVDLFCLFGFGQPLTGSPVLGKIPFYGRFQSCPVLIGRKPLGRLVQPLIQEFQQYGRCLAILLKAEIAAVSEPAGARFR